MMSVIVELLLCWEAGGPPAKTTLPNFQFHAYRYEIQARDLSFRLSSFIPLPINGSCCSSC